MLYHSVFLKFEINLLANILFLILKHSHSCIFLGGGGWGKYRVLLSCVNEFDFE